MNQHQIPYIWITFFLWIIGSIPSYSNIFHKNNPTSYSYTLVVTEIHDFGVGFSHISFAI